MLHDLKTVFETSNLLEEMPEESEGDQDAETEVDGGSNEPAFQPDPMAGLTLSHVAACELQKEQDAAI